MLVNADGRGVDQLQVAVISLGNSIENPVPDAQLAPSNEPVVAGGRRTIALRYISPG
jgi:hypothetical protein